MHAKVASISNLAMEDAKQTTAPAPATSSSAAPRGRSTSTSTIGARRPGASGQGGRGGGRGGNDRRGGAAREPREFEQKTLALDRVTRVTAGGKRMSFRASIVIGDKKGRVGFGVAKGLDVQLAMEKAVRQAKKTLIKVPLHNETIPHQVLMKFAAAEVLIKPAPKGTGLKAGGAARVILELAGVPNAVSKILRSSNKINIARATMEAIKLLRAPKTEATK